MYEVGRLEEREKGEGGGERDAGEGNLLGGGLKWLSRYLVGPVH